MNIRTLLSIGCVSLLLTPQAVRGDKVKELQTAAVQSKQASWGHWGPAPDRYSSWTSHSNRLIPVYTFGITLEGYRGEKSAYRRAERLQEIFGRVPEATLNPAAEYCDQTDIYRLQLEAAAAGKKYIILFVFDGMDWQTTWAAAIHRAGRVAYREGRGTGLAFQDYAGTVTDFGYFVSSPYAKGTDGDVNAQTFPDARDGDLGGYDPNLGGPAPWSIPTDPAYPIGQSRQRRHAVTDSSSSATSLTAGIKTYNAAVNVDHRGQQVVPIARTLQERGLAVGVVTSVPVSHATPAAAYGNNVDRDDYQDLSRDLLGLPSVSHRDLPLPGVDVLIGAGWGVTAENDTKQGANYVPGNRYIADPDLERVDIARGGRYRVSQRTAGQNGGEILAAAAEQAAQGRQRLLGFFGATGSLAGGHLPFATADGGYDPAPGNLGKAEVYSEADLRENPTLADMTRAALRVLETDPEGFWLMVEPGDVDWANHDNNVDNSLGAVYCGDAAFQAVAEWAAAKGVWDQTAVILTADHGHYLVLDQPEILAGEPVPASGLPAAER
ncbi:MAG: alkaline phosphatase [Planctomycetaceae bacterium]|nr:alkaline phosphatase [Planctomycetaceae bacterium]